MRTASTRSVGIQPGQTLRNGLSAQLENGLRAAVAVAMACVTAPNGRRLRWCPGVSAREVLDHLIDPAQMGHDMPEIMGLRPDGGLFFVEDDAGQRTWLLAMEAKCQGPVGNAIERWYKNYYMARLLREDIMFVTLAGGAGAVPGGVIRKTLNPALLGYDASRRWDVLYPTGPSMFMASEDWMAKGGVEQLVLDAVRRCVAAA